MRDFLWSYFAKTGEIDAYLLYKEHEEIAVKSEGLTIANALLTEAESDAVP
ncbi:YqzL family protein [Sulfoacidibacillus ferrooxidans]|uniref:YqzL family protein n=1 Tax=Sulfoacidibacillus ferrooxidans TaxID=2005001 RepID=A0A9X1V5S9_9BACL|nr:YqzL family protein [Sulfoacidibacillus ferrooxidans]MCI0181863.1 hypothetical protein [Sulfoacidibacillus ferrooxidans]